jgi:hypothetical protein
MGLDLVELAPGLIRVSMLGLQSLGPRAGRPREEGGARWRKGRGLRAFLREWGCLLVCLVSWKDSG